MLTRVGVVGLGRAARNIHLPALRKLGDVEIVGAYDPLGGAEALGVAGFQSVDELLAKSQPDILVIATPPSSHAELTRQGLLAGSHVFCEKPLAESLEAANEIAKLAAAQRRHVVVNSEFPFMPIHAEAKRRMAEPGFGNLLFVSMHQTFNVTPETEEGWRGADPQRTMKEFGTHVLDLAKFFFDERPKAIRARMPRPVAGPDYLCVVELEFSGDRIAHILLDRLTRGRHTYLDIRLDGTDGTIETSVGGRLQVTAGIRASGRKPFVDIDVAGGGRARLYRGEAYEPIASAPLDLFADATARLLGQTIAAFASGETPPHSLDEAINTLQLLLTCYAAPDGQRTSCEEW